jgi:acyl-CoA synthetase (AMP-forming)/AMP-acid ligase II
MTGLAGVLRRHAEATPDATALIVLAADGSEKERLSFLELDRRASALAAEIAGRGACGAPVLILEPTGAGFAAAFWGCLYAGAIATPAPAQPRGEGLARTCAIAADAGVGAVIGPADELGPRLGEDLGAIPWISSNGTGEGFADPAAIAPEAPVLLQYTSGSVSTPKGVIVTDAALRANLGMVCRAMGLDEEAVVFSWLPLHHDMGLIGAFLAAAFAGRPCVLSTPLSFIQKPERWLKGISRYRATYSGAPNFAYELCARRAAKMDLDGVDLSSWRTAFCGAEPVREAALARFAEAFAAYGFSPAALRPCYGLAEASLIVSGGPSGGVRTRPSASPQLPPVVGCGRPAEGLEVRIVGPEDRAPRPDGAEGEVWVRGPSIGAGYWNRPLESAETFEARLADGSGPYLRTGDLGVLTDGELFLTGRIKDLIIHQGANLHPADVEQAVAAADPALSPTGAVFQLDDGGIVAVHELEAPLEGPRRSRVAEKIALALATRFGLRLHDLVLTRRRAIPVTTSGKVRRRACRALYVAGALASRPASAEPAGKAAVPG